MSVTDICLLLSGICLFLFGMTLMGDGLRKVSGSRLEPILYRLSSTPLRGILLGTGVTAVLQSSCATSVMAVGFVNAGMMKVRQAIGVILGSILGTSITGWIVCLSYIEGTAGLGGILSAGTITGITAAIGILMRLYNRRQTVQNAGDILLGFAILMLGMSTMSGAVEALGEQPWFLSALTTMENPLLSILIGALFTAVLQSASAAVGILQALSVTGGVSFEVAFPLILGIAVGASFPVLLSALGAGTSGRRAALVYPIASAGGVAILGAIFYIVHSLFPLPVTRLVMDPFSLAALNTVLRLALLILLAPCIRWLESAVYRIIPERGSAPHDPVQRLEERFLEHPALALEQCRVVTGSMAESARASLEKAVQLLSAYSEEGFDQVQSLEEAVDRYEDAIGSYLVQFTGRELTAGQSARVSGYLRALTDFERISDHALNIAESAREIHEKALRFSDEAVGELAVLARAVTWIVRCATDSFTLESLRAAAEIEPQEAVIGRLCAELRGHHIERVQRGRCSLQNGFVLNDIAADMERVAAHCANIAEAAAELAA